MYKRKRRSRGLWLPQIGYDQWVLDNYYSSFNYQQTPDQTGISNIPAVAVSPLLHDRQVTPDVSAATGYDLQAFIGNSYFLRRIVGKIVCSVRGSNPLSTSSQFKCAAALFIARADEDEATNPIGLPIGGVTAAQQLENYNPVRADQMSAPWIWRRTWVLQNERAASTLFNFGFSASNVIFAPSSLDGPHVDAKTKRYVQRNERLYLSTAVQHYPNTAASPSVVESILWDVDLRYFGTPLKSRNDGAF